MQGNINWNYEGQKFTTNIGPSNRIQLKTFDGPMGPKIYNMQRLKTYLLGLKCNRLYREES